MKNFETIFNEVWPARPVRVIVGDTETYLGIYCLGLSELKDGQVEWLNSHKPIRLSYSAKRSQNYVSKKLELHKNSLGLIPQFYLDVQRLKNNLTE